MGRVASKIIDVINWAEAQLDSTSSVTIERDDTERNLSPLDWPSSVEARVPQADLAITASSWLSKTLRLASPVFEFEDLTLESILARPNGTYSGRALQQALVRTLAIVGTAYVEMRESESQVLELVWVPRVRKHFESGILRYYEYRDFSGRMVRVPRDRMLVFRNDLNPSDPTEGLSPLRGVLREFMTDSEARDFTYYVLANMPLPGMLIGPKGGTNMRHMEPWISKKLKRRCSGNSQDLVGVEFLQLITPLT